jgi:hypothetical protein
MTSGSQEGLPEVEDMNTLPEASDLELMAMATQPERNPEENIQEDIPAISDVTKRGKKRGRASSSAARSEPHSFIVLSR